MERRAVLVKDANPLCQATIQIDPTFAYYVDRSEASVAAELEQAGYRSVRYFVTDETKINGRLVRALRERGMEVWAMALGNGAYGTGHLPPAWRSWQMELLKPVNDGYVRLSPFSAGYTAWKKSALAQVVREHPFTGLEIAEAYFPEWNGLGTGVYGDVGPLAQAAFRQFSGGAMPEFRLRTSPLYYKKDRARYLLWIDLRVRAVNDFLHEVINGQGGVRDANPRIRIATWSLAVDAGRDPVGDVREAQGIDAVAMIRRVRPDAHVLQTHWPDWMRARLPADYIRRYRPFAEPIGLAFPSLPLGVQTDIGSLRGMRRSRAWLKRFGTEAQAQGYRFWTAYEHSIGLPMYAEPPLPLSAARLGDARRVRLTFSKRIDPASAAGGAFRICTTNGGFGGELAPIHVEAVDGQLVELWSDGFPPEAFELEVIGVRDTPDRWLLRDQPANTTPDGTRVSIPAFPD
ncbi:N-acyl-D-glucosamine 2-epimerase [Paenibacillus validus]|uniref:N-acyl-D-glucosamine 2-epimerase n=1 Tax=Paenibacillus validus TaxID=44253 RepID=A0A7X3CRG2_9BACL|nr:N-acyl-D-glucosamine 2-epimerase [Paenibacillus validus]